MVFSFSVISNFQTHINEDKSEYGLQYREIDLNSMQNACLLQMKLANMLL